MAGETVLSDINGTQKRVYDESGLKNALPGSSIFQRAIPFSGGSNRKVGEDYRFGVVLQAPNGFTHVGSAGGIVTLKQGRPMKIQQAAVTPFEMELREQYSFAALSRAQSEGVGSFASLTSEIIKAMKFSASNRLEATMLLGQYSGGLGTVESVAGSASAATMVITAATWRPGLWWACGPGTTLDAFTTTTLNNATGPIIITGITASSRTISFTCSGTLGSEIAAGDVLKFEGAYTDGGATHQEMPGLLAQASNTGTSLGISATTYVNWAGNTSVLSANMTSDTVEDIAGQLRDRGAMDKLSLFVSNKLLGSLMSAVKTQRNYDVSYSADRAKVGVRAIEYETPELGVIELVAHPFMAHGEALFLNTSDVERVGSSDLMFGVPGGDGVDAPVWERVANTNAAECILFSDQAECLKAPGHAWHLTGITYT